MRGVMMMTNWHSAHRYSPMVIVVLGGGSRGRGRGVAKGHRHGIFLGFWGRGSVTVADANGFTAVVTVLTIMIMVVVRLVGMVSVLSPPPVPPIKYASDHVWDRSKPVEKHTRQPTRDEHEVRVEGTEHWRIHRRIPRVARCIAWRRRLLINGSRSSPPWNGRVCGAPVSLGDGELRHIARLLLQG